MGKDFLLSRGLFFGVFLQLSSVLWGSSCPFDSAAVRYGNSSEALHREKEDDYFYNLCKFLYTRNVDRVSKKYGEIPKIIHQIWMGNEMPEELKVLCTTWSSWEGWSYQLWDEESILNLGLVNQDLFFEAKSLGEKSDIARLEILERFGGIYVDTDFECLSPEKIEELCQRYDLIMGCEPLEHKFSVGNAFFASSPHHPFLRSLNQKIRKSFYQYRHDWAVETTGPMFISRAVVEDYPLLSGGIILPPTYLYPLGVTDDFSRLEERWDQFIHPETLGIHYWLGGWWKQPRWKNLEFIRSSPQESKAKETFTKIYEKGVWGYDADLKIGTSGLGSRPGVSAPFLQFLESFLFLHPEVKNIVDVGCGDYKIFEDFTWEGLFYTGLDVVEKVVDKDRELYGSENVQFFVHDALEEKIPPGDLVLCKDVVIHLPLQDVMTVMNKLLQFPHAMVVTDVENHRKELSRKNSEISLGQYRCVDLTAPPFSFRPTHSFTFETDHCTKQVLLFSKGEDPLLNRFYLSVTTPPEVKGWCSQEKTGRLLDLVLETKPKVYVEIGVFEGASLFPVVSALKYLDHGVAVGIDPWDRWEAIRKLDPITQAADLKRWGEVDFSSVSQNCVRVFREHGLLERCVFFKATSIRASVDLGEIDILHLDGNCSERGLLADLICYLPKVVPGGYIILNDALEPKADFAKEILLESCKVQFSTDSGNCLFFKKNE